MPTQREWTTIREYDDILFDYYNGIARITINRERYRNAFTPTTTAEMSDALRICREEADIDVIVITGVGDKAFCSGGDQNVKGRGGYIGKDGVPRLSVLDVQKQIRSIPKPVIAAVNGFAIGGGHVLHVVCDLSIASENAIFELIRACDEMGMMIMAESFDEWNVDKCIRPGTQTPAHSPCIVPGPVLLGRYPPASYIIPSPS